MPRTLLLEIGCEELPTSCIDAALEQLARIVPAELARARITHGEVRVMGTPRRLAVRVAGVADKVEPRTEDLIGPAESAARGADGAWSKAAEGFARKNNVALDALSIADTPKGRYLRASRVLPGGETAARLADVLIAWITGITFPKSMRWADIETPFARPIQWLVALFGRDVVPLTFVNLRAGRSTLGHRFLAPKPIELGSADDYVAQLRSAHVLVDPAERLAAQRDVLAAAAKSEGGTLVPSEFLEHEVLGLVEEPFAVVGHFDAGYLTLPEELIETVMSHHQRYFAVRGANGKLLPAFVTTANTALDPASVRKGNERAMRPRLADARFFVDHDRATTLESRVARLDGVVYHQKLGTYGDKATRLAALAPWLAIQLGADEAHAARAAQLAKADLVSLAVGEFPELQGIMGRDYARNDHEPEPVAIAIAEHYLPKSADDSVADSKLGASLALADRLDTLVGFFAIGQKPSGAGDPFGLRRAALGWLRTLFHHRARVSLAAAIARAYAGYTRELPRTAADTQREIVEFVRERLDGLLIQQHPIELVRACIAASSDDAVDVLERLEALVKFRSSADFARVVKAFERVFNISREAPAGEPDAALLTAPAERKLLESFVSVRPKLTGLIHNRDFAAALALVAVSFSVPVDEFFTQVFVMDQQHPELRDARLRLLGRIADEVGVIARFDTLAASANEKPAPTSA